MNPHPWGDPGTPTVHQLQGQVVALQAELARRDFDIDGALALFHDKVANLQRRLAESEEARARLEAALHEHWTWGQYLFSLDPERMGA